MTQSISQCLVIAIRVLVLFIIFQYMKLVNYHRLDVDGVQHTLRSLAYIYSPVCALEMLVGSHTDTISTYPGTKLWLLYT